MDEQEGNRALWLGMIIDSFADGITVSDENGRFEIFNSKMTQITGYSAGEANGQRDFISLLYPDEDERGRAFQGINEILNCNCGREVETTIRTKEGTKKTLLVSTVLLPYKDRKLFLSSYRDITSRKNNEERLAILNQALRLYERLLEFTGDGVFRYTLDEGRIIFANPAFTKILGLDCLPADVVGKLLREIVIDGDCLLESPQDKIEIRDLECRFKTLKGQERYVILSSFVREELQAGKKIVEATIEDFTLRKMAEKERDELHKEIVRANKRLELLALKDSHTGLYNHRYLKEAIESAFSQSQRQGFPFAVIMADLDYFKAINDAHGHLFGDLILKQFSAQLKKEVRKYDVIIRYGGEEFLIICPNMSIDSASTLANRIRDKINLCDFGNKKEVIRLKLSLAVTSYPQDGATDGMKLVGLADRILNQVKADGGNRIYTSKNLGKDELKTADNINIVAFKEKIDKLGRRSLQSLIEAMFTFAKAVKAKEDYTGTQAEKIVFYATEIARRMNLNDSQIELIRQASMLHDLGKIGINESILRKPSSLNKEEYEEIKKHPLLGADIVSQAPSLLPLFPAVLYHHERWDGCGYPSGLKKEQIPLSARIVGLCDVYVALTSDRPYRKAYAESEARVIIMKNSGSQFDPEITKIFFETLESAHQGKTVEKR
jgi:diguanylate cyclase (GGDEF)-like protein/PAS domain S-box-containing protein